MQPPAQSIVSLRSDQISHDFVQLDPGNIQGWKLHSVSGLPALLLQCPHVGNGLPYTWSELLVFL